MGSSLRRSAFSIRAHSERVSERGVNTELILSGQLASRAQSSRSLPAAMFPRSLSQQLLLHTYQELRLLSCLLPLFPPQQPPLNEHKQTLQYPQGSAGI